MKLFKMTTMYCITPDTSTQIYLSVNALLVGHLTLPIVCNEMINSHDTNLTPESHDRELHLYV